MDMAVMPFIEISLSRGHNWDAQAVCEQLSKWGCCSNNKHHCCSFSLAQHVLVCMPVSESNVICCIILVTFCLSMTHNMTGYR
jgi:hypothetical protein